LCVSFYQVYRKPWPLSEKMQIKDMTFFHVFCMLVLVYLTSYFLANFKNSTLQFPSFATCREFKKILSTSTGFFLLPKYKSLLE
jgi:hypothetical protein